MSRMLTFFELGFASATALANSGRYSAARQALRGLRATCDLEPGSAHRLHTTAAEWALRSERYAEARKHLRRAVELDPNNAAGHFALGQAHEADPFGCDRMAVRRYRKAIQLNANQPKYRATLGRALVRVDNVQAGVKILCRAAEAAPSDPEVLEIVAEGLREAGQPEVAFRLMSHARFLAPGDGAIKKLWDRSRFSLTAATQQAHRNSEVRPVENPAVLPFLRVSEMGQTQKIRRDAGSPKGATVPRLRAYRQD